MLRHPNYRVRKAHRPRSRCCLFPPISKGDDTMTTRRNFLLCAGAGVGAMLIGSRMAFASVESDQRFVFVIQRGAADGLNIVVPYADPAYASLRGALAIDPSTATKL